MKKAFSLFLIFVLALNIFIAVPATANAVETAVAETGAASGATGNCKWTLNGDKLTISGSGTMADYEPSGSNTPWAKYKNNVTSIILESEVSNIGKGAFAGMTALKSLRMEGFTDHIGEYAFSGCVSLTTIDVFIGTKEIRAHAFEGCTSLTEVFAYRVDKISSDAFRNCSGLSSFDTNSEIEYIAAGAFEGSALLNKDSDYIYINTKKNNDYYNTYNDYYCMIYVNTYHSYGKKALSYRCVTIGEEAFKDTDLTKIRMFNTVKYINNRAFYNCSELNSIAIPGSVVEIGEKAFGYSDSGKNNDFTIYAYEGSAGHKYAVANGFKYVKITPDDAMETGKTGFCDWKVSYGGVLTISGNGQMGDYRFIQYESEHPWSGNLLSYSHPSDLCSIIEEIVIEEGVTEIGTLAFPDFRALEKVKIASSVKIIGQLAFDNCTNLNTIEIPYGVNTISDSAFKRCYYLSEIIIPDSVTSINDSAFTDCLSLTIYGYSGSYAEEYAKKNDISFESLGKAPNHEKILGDADGNGTVEVSDATFIQRKLSRIDIPFELNDVVSDADGDGKVTLTDVTYIQRWLIDLKSNDKIGKQI